MDAAGARVPTERAVGIMIRALQGTMWTCIGALAGAAALAADLPTKKPAAALAPAVVIPSTWQVDLTVYSWIASLAGDAGARQFPTAPIHAGFGALLDHLRGAFSGAAVVRNETFIGGVDLIWADLGTGVNFQNPSSPLYGAGADLRLNTALITGFGGVRIPIGPPDLALYGTAGARYFYDEISIALRSPVSGFERDASASKSWVDPIVGLSAHYRINDKWFVNGEGDIGGLHNSATGQALGAVGYNWTQTIATTVGYRMVYGYDMQSAPNGSFRLQEWVYGPYAALKLRF
jgi:hypothetical protein